MAQAACQQPPISNAPCVTWSTCFLPPHLPCPAPPHSSRHAALPLTCSAQRSASLSLYGLPCVPGKAGAPQVSSTACIAGLCRDQAALQVAGAPHLTQARGRGQGSPLWSSWSTVQAGQAAVPPPPQPTWLVIARTTACCREGPSISSWGRGGGGGSMCAIICLCRGGRRGTLFYPTPPDGRQGLFNFVGHLRGQGFPTVFLTAEPQAAAPPTCRKKSSCSAGGLSPVASAASASLDQPQP